MGQRRNWFSDIDFARGLGILLVVIGHCFPDASAEGGISVPVYRYIFQIVYSFHMPLFFFLAGFVASRASGDLAQYISNRAKRLLVPYFCVGLVYMPVKMLLNKFANQPFSISALAGIFIGNNPNGGLWFLYDLFIILVLLSIILQYTKSMRNVFLIAICVLAVDMLKLFPKVGGHTDAIPYYFFFTALGLWYRENYYIVAFKSWITLACSAILAVAAIVLYVFKGVAAASLFSAIFGTTTLVLLMRYLVKSMPGWLSKALKTLSDYSMDIYICHGMIMAAIRIVFYSILKWNYHVVTLLMLVMGLFGSMLISKTILRPVKLFRKLVLGMD